MEKAVIVFQPEGKRIEAEVGTTILDAAKGAGIKLESLCGGKTTCGKCRVIVTLGAGNLDGTSEAEHRLIRTGKFSQDLLEEGYRIACAARIKSSEKLSPVSSAGDHIVVKIPLESQLGPQKILVEGIEVPLKINPLVNKYFVELPPPTLEQPTPDFERLLLALNKEHGLSGLKVGHKLLKQLPDYLRNSGWKPTVAVWNNGEIISVEPGNTFERRFGLAVDIGTTTVVGYLVDLNSGKLVGVGSLLNPQIPYGEDVITRITYCIQNLDGLDRLNKVVVEGLNTIIGQACSKANVKREEIYEITIVGNTAMHHIFLKINPKFLALSPFSPAIRRGVDVNAEELGLRANPNANVHVLPVIAGFVGADTVGVLLSTNLYKERELTLAIDIGTNGELMLGNKDSIEVCSTAAGPAFEGAHMKHGMRGEPGAIDTVSIDPETLDVEYSTIDDAPPKGICGSGIVDVVAELFMAGVILRSGNINAELQSPKIRKNNAIREFVLVPSEEAADGVGDIVVTQADIREIQLAKSAMYAGAKILMERRGVTEKDIDRVYLAGAFGTYIDKWNAKVMGLYPDIPLDRVKSVGNAAGMGAKHALISRERRDDAESIARDTHYLELTIAPEFNDEFISAMYFPHIDIDRFPSLRKLCEKLPTWSEIIKSGTHPKF